MISVEKSLGMVFVEFGGEVVEVGCSDECGEVRALFGWVSVGLIVCLEEEGSISVVFGEDGVG